ncbi:MAG: tRNA (adenosine(37)-N6)-dimethylallyltransferase MiaA [Leadbetterella sp.]|nr:tRNA (adenosine(37)-N6)-dimethylallyltransferase MiaA [Leadbetterella sp.]
MKGNLVVIAGPTAVGKTDLCIRLAQHFDAEVISCDSRQLYKEMQIGTARPTPGEMQGVKHHFIASHSVRDLYSAGDFGRDTDRLLKEYFQRKDIAILSGGTGLFIRAVTHGLDDMPSAPEELRSELMQRLTHEGLEVLQRELLALDPAAGRDMDMQNPQRVVRALEVCLSTGKPFSEHRVKKTKIHDYNLVKIGLERPREELYARINRRVDLMLEQGLVEEARSLLPFSDKNALQTVGYKEVFGYLRGEYDYPAMTELLKRNTRRYAKRQMTWFKNQDAFEWFHAEDEEGIKRYIREKCRVAGKHES